MTVLTTGFLTLGDGSDESVEIAVLDGIALTDVDKADQQWEGPLTQLVASMTRAGFRLEEVPPSWSWTWGEMLRNELPLDSSVISLEHNEQCQGLMALYLDPRPCYHSVGTNGIYLAYIAAAPWNMGYYLAAIGQAPFFDDVGLILLTLAATKSVERGCNGRVIVHAAKGSEDFYRNCGITETGPDEVHPSKLIRFEITVEQAKTLIEGKS